MLKTAPLMIASAFVVIAVSFALAFNQGMQSAYASAASETHAAQ
ncbi:MAG: hypothetical protein R3C58_14765 [Parvularculaceae bacterium]